MRRQKIGGSGGEYSGVEVGIVDLVAAPATEQLGAVHVDGDVVAVALGDGVRCGVNVAVHGGARHARVEAVAHGARRRRAPRELAAAIPTAYEGPTHGPGPNAVLESPKRVGPMPGSELRKMRTWLWERNASDPGHRNRITDSTPPPPSMETLEMAEVKQSNN